MEITSEQEAYNYCEETRVLKNRTELACLELGKRLFHIKKNGYAESQQYGGFDLYLDEIKVKKATADHMMRVYQRFCFEFGIPMDIVVQAGGYTRLYELLPLAKTKERALEVLEQAKLQPSRSSIKQMVKEALGAEECVHENTILVRVCVDCSHKERIIETKENTTN